MSSAVTPPDGEDKTEGRVSPKLWAALIAALLFGGLALSLPYLTGGGKDGEAAAPTSTTAPPSVTAPNATAGATTPPTTVATSAAAEGEKAILSGTATRKPDKSDAAEDEAAIRAVMPRWGSFDIEKHTIAADWVATFKGMPEVSNAFEDQSKNQFFSLWGGAMQQGVSVTAGKITSIKSMGNQGPTAVYQVVMQQSLKWADGTSVGDTTQTWLIEVAHLSEGSKLLIFRAPSDDD